MALETQQSQNRDEHRNLVNGDTDLTNGLANGGSVKQKAAAKVKSLHDMDAVIDINKNLSALFNQQVNATPDAVALEDETTTLTYSELNSKVADLARRIRNCGVKRDSLVGVLFGRSADYIVACLAALRAGGAFLVLESAYPPDLMKDVVEDAKPVAILTLRDCADYIKADVPLIYLDEPGPYANGDKPSDYIEAWPFLSIENDLERAAFVCYTSGTTGRPKGIVNPHRAAVRSYDLRFRLNDVRPGDRVACNAFFIWEMLRPLLRGATVVAVPDDASYDPVSLVDLLSSRRITETLMTPTLLSTVLSRHTQIAARLPDLRTLWLNGEVVSTDLARRAMAALPNTRLLNCYSASETHEIACGDIAEMVDMNAHHCPVGPPMDPDHTYVLDANGKRVKEGVTGELYVGGSLLAHGYLHLPEVTAKAFTPDPFDPTPGAVMYRTGDEAKMLPSGLLDISGRVGGMLKVRGYSVVPGKVESTISKFLAVSHCAVVAQGDGLERQLVAYFVRDAEEPGERHKIEVSEYGYSPGARRALSSALAQYQIPALWVELPALPTHDVSGKIDVKRLPPPTRQGSPQRDARVDGVDGQRDAKVKMETIVEAWAASLKCSPSAVTPEHDFFDLGGHSLALANLANRLSKRFGFAIAVGDLAGNPTLEGHLKVVCDARDGHTAAVQADLPAVLRADSVLPEDIQPSNPKMCAINDASTILLTGATGFFGAFLLDDLVKSTSAQIICLVRFSDPSEDDHAAGIARVRRNLLDLGLWHDSILDRVQVLPGNISRDRLGLSREHFERLAHRVQVIVHAAATVNLVYPYAALRNANVGGTREIVRLASLGGSTLQYISTNGVLPPSSTGWPENANLEVDEVPDKIPDGYGQSKWVAEQLVYEAGRRGLPVKVHRLGTLSGHSTSGSANAWDLVTALIVESLRIGYAPDIEDWRAELTAVDYVSKAIVVLANNTETTQNVFHLGEANPPAAAQLFEDLGQLGYPTQRLPWDEWVQMWKDKRGSTKGGEGAFTVDILRGGMPTVGWLKSPIILSDAATRPALDNLYRPKVDKCLLETYARHWYARGWLPRPPSRSNVLAPPVEKSPLAGKVVVVTGASSGIGAAVATALAREGAHVALAARRTEQLESVRSRCKRLSAGSSKILIHKTDVTDRAQVESLVHAANGELGPVDILVSCAGVMYFTMMANAHVEEWGRTVDVNCKGLLHCLSSTVPDMLKRNSGHIVAISSDAGRKVFPGLGVYSASKFFVEAALQSLRLETAGTGLRVTSVQPGNTATDLLGMSTDQEAVKKYGEPSGAKILDADDVARSIVYALKQPGHVAVNEVLIEPRDEPI